jgi:hypothetical protein
MAVTIKIFQLGFCLFACAFPTVISSIFGKSFPFPFPYFVLSLMLLLLFTLDLEGCKRRVLLLKLPGEPEECNEDEHLLYLNSLIDMTNESMMQALGILLKWLDMSWKHLYLELQKQPPVLAVNVLSL